MASRRLPPRASSASIFASDVAPRSAFSARHPRARRRRARRIALPVVAFHDVVDFQGDLDDDAVTVDRLIGFFEWLRANRWTTISLDDVDAARRGKKTLPERSILITFDDGYRSLYTRVFPLVLAYRMPIVAALVGSWIDAPAGSKVSYGRKQVPRERFRLVGRGARDGAIGFGRVCFAQLRSAPRRARKSAGQRAAGGEHAHLHAGARLRNGGAVSPPHRRRSHALARAAGEPARACAAGDGVALRTLQRDRRSKRRARPGSSLRSALDPEPASIHEPMAIARYLPTNDPSLATMVEQHSIRGPLPNARRLVAMNPAAFWTGDDAGMDERLGPRHRTPADARRDGHRDRCRRDRRGRAHRGDVVSQPPTADARGHPVRASRGNVQSRAGVDRL